ncbi:MAG TPA: hypothetical protein VLD65_10940 [Anaerolineales bacterium]|nr:hypothetical protein [Anaerolineales bacterium]
MKGFSTGEGLPWLKDKARLAPFTFFWVILLAYGIYIPWLGLYGDDWMYLWNYHILGAQSFPAFVAIDRPYSAWIYILATGVIGERIWAYHLLALLLRYLDVLALWWVLKLIWPKHPRQVLTVALLFAVYPGFTQQSIPIEFIMHFTVLGLFLASLGLMILAVHSASQGKQLWNSIFLELLSLLCAAGMFSAEYFVGLELIRPVILWLALTEGQPLISKRVSVIVAWYWPFLLLLTGFIYWRVFIQRFEFYQPVLLVGLQANPVQQLLSLGQRFVNDLYQVTVRAWGKGFSFSGGLQTILFSSALIGFSLVTVGWLVVSPRQYRSRRTSSPEPIKDLTKEPVAGKETNKRVLPERFKWALQAALFGLVSLAVAGIPFWITDLPVSLTFPWDRATLPFMLGASLLLAALLEALFTQQIERFVLTCLVALSVGAFAKNERNYIKEWSEQSQLIWQLVWRAPQLKAGTTLVTERTSLNYLHDNGLTPLVNWTYDPKLTSNRFTYNVFELAMRKNTLNEVNLSAMGVPIERRLRSATFSSSTSEIVLFTFHSPSCLRIIRPDDVSNPAVPPPLRKIENFSQLDQIMIEASEDVVPPLTLGSEPPHTWCYYFEKADLARQVQDWPQVMALWEAADMLSFAPKNASEYEPFIEAFARLKDWDTAVQLSQAAMVDPQEVEGVCGIWNRVADALALDSPDLEKARELRQTLGCPAN